MVLLPPRHARAMFNATDTARGRDAGAKRGTESLPSLSKLLFSFTPHPRCILRSYGSQGLGSWCVRLVTPWPIQKLRSENLS